MDDRVKTYLDITTMPSEEMDKRTEELRANASPEAREAARNVLDGHMKGHLDTRSTLFLYDRALQGKHSPERIDGIIDRQRDQGLDAKDLSVDAGSSGGSLRETLQQVATKGLDTVMGDGFESRTQLAAADALEKPKKGPDRGIGMNDG